MNISPLPKAIEALHKRGLAIVLDDSTEPSRALLISPAEFVTSELIAEALNITGGLLSVAVSRSRVDEFALPEMTRPRTDTISTQAALSRQYCISVEAREGVSTGISAADRAHTIRILGEKTPQPRKLVSPGHIFPIECRDGGVLVRAALPEAALDLVTLSGHSDAAMCVDLLDRSGEFMREQDVLALSQRASIPLVKLADIIRYRLSNENIVYRVAEARLPTRTAGEVRSIIYRSKLHAGEHVALVKGVIDPTNPVLTRVQLEFTFGDVFGGNNPPSRNQVHAALNAIGERGSGIFLYLRRPLRGQIRDQVGAWKLKFEEKPASMMREFGLGAQILSDLGAKKIELLAEKPRDYSGLSSFGIEIVSQQPIPNFHSEGA